MCGWLDKIRVGLFLKAIVGSGVCTAGKECTGVLELGRSDDADSPSVFEVGFADGATS